MSAIENSRPSLPRRTLRRRLSAALALAFAGLVIGAVPASAHIQVDSTNAVQSGDMAEFTLRVPNESTPATSGGRS